MEPRTIRSYHTLRSYSNLVQKLRAFFLSKGYLEVDAQSRKSILAACEDPATVSLYTFANVQWPLPQTGQMWLEYELLTNPDVPGVFCTTTSYRNEPEPDPYRYLTIFPMFEFETHGDMQVLINVYRELFEYLGFGDKELFREGDYKFIADYYGTDQVGAKEEEKMWEDFGSVFFLKNFPIYTHPFFNMKKEGDVAKKVDVIVCGMESVGSAERSCNPDEMRELFHTISDGMYSKLLYNLFGKERVDKELDEFLSLDFFPRVGAGIGVNRLLRGIELAANKDVYYGKTVANTQTQATV